LQVKEIMNTDVKTINLNSNVREAAELMSKSNIGGLIVVEDSKLVGIVTERDVMKKVVALNKSATKTKVKAVMTKKVIMIDPDKDVEEAAEIMLERKIKKLPIVYKNKLIGILTATDICAAQPKLIEQLAQLMLVPGKKKIIAG